MLMMILLYSLDSVQAALEHPSETNTTSYRNHRAVSRAIQNGTLWQNDDDHCMDFRAATHTVCVRVAYSTYVALETRQQYSSVAEEIADVYRDYDGTYMTELSSIPPR